MSKAKKKIASVFSDSSVGKKVITQSLGPTGKEYLKLLKEMITKFDGKKEAKNVMKGIYKFAVKGKMLYDDVLII